MNHSDNAATALQKQEDEKNAWWAETVRRCKDAARHPGHLVDADTFFRGVREEIEIVRRKLDRS